MLVLHFYFVIKTAKLDILRMEFDEILRAATLLVDYYWTDYAAIESGQVVIIDYSGYNLSIFRRYSFTEKLNFVMLFLVCLKFSIFFSDLKEASENPSTNQISISEQLPVQVQRSTHLQQSKTCRLHLQFDKAVPAGQTEEKSVPSFIQQGQSFEPLLSRNPPRMDGRNAARRRSN